MYSLRMRGLGVIVALGIIFAFGWFAFAFAQDGSVPPPPPPPSGGGDFGGSQPPPPPPPSFGGSGFSAGFEGGHPPPPPGDFGGGYQQGNFQQQRPPEGQYQQQYREEAQKQYEQQYKQRYEQERSRQGDSSGGMMRGEPRQSGGTRGGEGMMQRGGPEGGMMQRGGGDFGGDYGGYGGEEDDSDARQAEMEEREKQMEKQQLNEMKRNLRGMEQGMKMVKTMMDKLAKQNVPIPSEYATLLSDLTQALAVVKGASEMTDEVQSAMEVIMERGEELRDIGPKLGMLAQWPKTVKQAEAQVKRLATQFARVKKSKNAASYPSLLAKVEASVGTVTGALAQAKNEAAQGDLETAMETLRDGVFEATEDAYDSMRVLENMASMSRVVKQAEKEIARYEKEAARYEKKGADVSTLRGLIVEMKRILAEVKNVMSDASADPEELFNVMNSAEGLRNDAEAELQHLRGNPSSAERQIQSRAATKANASVGKALDGLKAR